MNRIIIRVVLFFFLIVSISYISAQSVAAENNEIEIAVLVRGPVESMGFPLIYPNALELWLGYYRYLESEVVVSFTRKDIMLPEEWESFTCNKIKGFSPDHESFFYKDTKWSVLFKFSEGVPLDCDFINIFILRLKYFLRDSSPDSPPLLPAILEIR
ncbi:MAG: hypothetical protein KAQ93_04615 [Spirochaetales bacterium]|nr:hypothetical protein [Spirochaetales bacterium]